MPGSGSRILLLGGDTDHNIGDRAILVALVHCLGRHDPTARIATVGRADAAPPIAGLETVIPRGTGGMRQLLACARAADRILVAGGGLFQDDDSRVKMPYWAARIGLLRSVNARIAAHAIGAGPLQHGESRLAARMACAALTSISVRDRHARAALARCTPRPIEIVPDPAFMLEPAPPGAADALLLSAGLPAGRPFLAVTIRQWFHARGGWVPRVLRSRAGLGVGRDEERFGALLDALADGIAGLARRLDAGVLMLPGYNVAHEADDVACEALAGRLRGTEVRLARIADPRLYKSVLGRAALVISARMHPLILAAGMGTPLVGLEYNRKFSGMLELLGITREPLRLDDFPARWGPRELQAEGEAALARPRDLGARAAMLAEAVRSRTLAIAFGGMDMATADASHA
jgi:polysaccharide pyruvyl transferase WcaK-like protein